MKSGLVLLTSLLVTTEPAVAQQSQAAKLFPPRPIHEDTHFVGRRVELAGSWAVVGDETAAALGHVYFFRRGPSGWSFEQTVRGPLGSRFGGALASDGETTVVGASLWPFPKGRGKVFVYENSNGHWTESVVLQPKSLGPGSFFGYAVDVCGDVLVVGVPGTDVPRQNSGEVFLYERVGGTWTLVERLLQPPIPDVINWNYRWFGLSVAVDGDVVVAGAPGWTGAAYVFERDASGWSRTGLLADPTPTMSDDFGAAVGVSGDRIVVGEPNVSGNSNFRPGSAFVFEKDSAGAWVLVKEIEASDGFSTPETSDEFGGAVDIDGDRIIAGMNQAKIHGPATGAGYLFERGENGWPKTETRQLIADDSPGISEFLGWDVAIDGGFLSAGAPGAWVGGTQHGAAYIFEVELGQTSCDGSANSTGVPARLTVTGSAGADDRDLTLSIRDCPKGVLGIFLMSDSRLSQPLGDGVLCLGSPRRLAPTVVTGKAGLALLDLDYGDPFLAANLISGNTWVFQFWYLDPDSGPGGQNLSNAIALTLD